MLETVQATADVDLVGDPFDLSQQVARDPNLWRRLGADKARLHADASALGSLVLRRASFGDHAGRVQVVAEANLAALTYGKAGKALTLPPADLDRSLALLLSEAVKALPAVAPRTLSAWKVSRVDASMTLALQPLDAGPVFDTMRDAFFSLQGLGGRAEVSQPGPRSLMLQRTKEDKVRFYSKTDESLHNASPLPLGLDPARAHLVRLESQIVARTARKRYGDTLQDLATDGIAVATSTLRDWLDLLGDTALATGPREVLNRLILGGCDPARAMALIGPAMLLRAGGPHSLVQQGVSKRTAYAWAKEVRSYVPDDVWADALGIPLSVDDAVYADSFCERI
jgi:hypothetical protein